MYAMLMAEQGIAGLALYLALILVLLGRGWRLMRTATTDEGADIGRSTIIFGLYIAAGGLFSHNVLDEAQAMFLMAFIVVAGLDARATRAAELSILPRRPRSRAPRLIRW
jgi:O-antigen ligase